MPGYAPRTIYRYANKLAELEILEREEEPGVPSRVIHTLSDPCGRELYELVNRFADATARRSHKRLRLGLTRPAGRSLGAGMVEELACEGRSPSELARVEHGLSSYQVNRRAGLFKAVGC